MKKSYTNKLIISTLALFCISLSGCALDVDGNDKNVPVYLGVNFTEDEKNAANAHMLRVDGDEKVADYYYAAGDEVYLHISLENPEQYEILSFMVNGYKYQSYQFAAASDSTNLYLAITLPENHGIYTYEVDAIKYVIGESIRDVDMTHADKNIKVGIKYNNLPESSLIEEKASYSTYTSTISIVDEDQVTSDYSLNVKLGGETIYTSSLAVGNNDVSISNLKIEKKYSYNVMAKYEDYDGLGIQEKVLLEGTFTTLNGASFAFETGKQTIDYTLTLLDTTSAIESVKLYDGETLVATSETLTGQFSGLLSNHTFSVKANYTYGTSQIGQYSDNATTSAVPVPTINFANISSDKTSISYQVVVIDANGVCANGDVQLLKNDEVVTSSSELTGSFSNLLSNNSYTIRFNYSYNLNDGLGSVNTHADRLVNTQAKVSPTVEITNISSDKTSISYKIIYEDSENIYIPGDVQLMLDGEVVQTSSNVEGKFENLLSNNNYTIRYNYSFDLNDGIGEYNDSVEKVVTTSALSVPNVSLNHGDYKTTDGIEITNGVITGIGTFTGDTVIFNDPIGADAFKNNSTLTTIYICSGVVSLGDSCFSSSDVKNVIFIDDFVPIIGDGTFDLTWDPADFYFCVNDSFYETFMATEASDSWWNTRVETHTLKYSEASEEIQNYFNSIKDVTAYDLTVTSSSCSLNIVDKDSTIKSLSTTLYLGEELVTTVENKSNIVFDNLLSAHDYYVIFAYYYDLNDGKGSRDVSFVSYFSTPAKSAPIVSIPECTSDSDSISYSMTITDPDNSCVGTITKVELFEGEAIVDTITDGLLTGTFNNLTASTSYSLKVSYQYDLNDETGVHNASITNTGVLYVDDVYQFNKAIFADALGIYQNDSRLYAIYTGRGINWSSACELSVAKGGYLMTLTSDDELSIAQSLVDLTDNYNTWYGGYYEDDAWHWVSGETFTVNSNYFYYPSTIDPSNGNVLKSWFDSSKYWYISSNNSNSLIAYIVEVEIGGEPINTLATTV